MRSLLSLSIVTLLACTVAPQVPRFAVGAPRVTPIERNAPSPVGPQLSAALAASALQIAGCFDELSARRNLSRAVRVALALQLRGGSLTVAEVAPSDGASVSDQELVRCLGDLAAGWALHGDDADVSVPLAVAPRALAGAAEAMARAAAAPAFQPEE